MMLSCSDCGKVFTRRDNLLRHLKSSQHSADYSTNNNHANNDDNDEEESFHKVATNYPIKRYFNPESDEMDNKRLAEARKSIQTKVNALKRNQMDNETELADDNTYNMTNPYKRMKSSKKLQDLQLNQEHGDVMMNGSKKGLYSDNGFQKSDVQNKSDNESTSDEDESYSLCSDISNDDVESCERYVNTKPTKRGSDPNKLVKELKDMKSVERGMKSQNIVPSKSHNELLLKEIARIKNSIREKYRAHRLARTADDIQLENMFKPITRPLQELTLKAKLEPIYEAKIEPKEIDYSENEVETPIRRKYLKAEQTSTPIKYQEEGSLMSEDEFTTPTRSTMAAENSNSTLNASRHIVAEYFKLYTENSPKIDNTYGVYLDNNEWKIGNSNLVMSNHDIIIKGKRYKTTMGLCELLFMKDPVKSFCTEEDLNNYRTILKDTSAYKRNHDENEQIKGSKGNKYKEIISKLIPQQGMGLLQKANDGTDYIHSNDPNDLVERLRLLIPSFQGGNNIHLSEILSIIQELKDTNIIIA